jgi:hypothetical protein
MGYSNDLPVRVIQVEGSPISTFGLLHNPQPMMCAAGSPTDKSPSGLRPLKI